jgi:hypothetical protein
MTKTQMGVTIAAQTGLADTLAYQALCATEQLLIA